jgi:cytoskeleton protein RodZ
MDIGAELRAAREAKGLSLGTLAQRTRVQPRTLTAIETNNLAAIPPRPFGRGFVRAYAEEVNLDPERTVQSYFSQFPPAPEPVRPAQSRATISSAFEPPSQWAGLGTAGAILALLVIVALMAGRRSDVASETSTPSADPRTGRGAIGTSGSGTTAGSPSPTPAPTDATPASAPAVPSAPPLRLTLAVTRPCWIAATADGQRALYRIVQSGERLTIDAQRDIAIRFGDAGAVEWTINGRKGAPLGAAGAVRDLKCGHGECR